MTTRVRVENVSQPGSNHSIDVYLIAVDANGKEVSRSITMSNILPGGGFETYVHKFGKLEIIERQQLTNKGITDAA